MNFQSISENKKDSKLRNREVKKNGHFPVIGMLVDSKDIPI